MSTPVIFTITPEGLDAAVTQDSIGLSVELVSISAHLVDGTEWGRFDLSGGLVEPTTHTARFSAILKSTTAHSAYQLKIWTSDDIVFAQAVSVSPLVVVAANIDFAASFGLTLTGVPAGSVTISINPDDSVAQVLMMQHLGAADPHPQYAMKVDLADEVVARENADLSLSIALAAEITRAQNAEASLQALIDGLGNGEYSAGTYTITIQPYTAKKFTLDSGGGGGAGSSNGGVSGSSTDGADGIETSLVRAGYWNVTAHGGLHGESALWANGSAYTDGIGGLGGLVESSGISIDSYVNGDNGLNRAAGENVGGSYGFGGLGSAPAGDSGYTWGGGGGQGARAVVTVDNPTSTPIIVTLKVGKGGRGGWGVISGVIPNVGLDGRDGYAKVESV